MQTIDHHKPSSKLELQAVDKIRHSTPVHIESRPRLAPMGIQIDHATMTAHQRGNSLPAGKRQPDEPKVSVLSEKMP